MIIEPMNDEQIKQVENQVQNQANPPDAYEKISRDILDHVQDMVRDQGVDGLTASDPEFQDVLDAIGEGVEKNDTGIILRRGQRRPAKRRRSDWHKRSKHFPLINFGKSCLWPVAKPSSSHTQGRHRARIRRYPHQACGITLTGRSKATMARKPRNELTRAQQSARRKRTKNVRSMSASAPDRLQRWIWDDLTNGVAVQLAEGLLIKEAAKQAHLNERTIRRWLDHVEFAAEVDRLTLMHNTASRAYRMRLVNRVVRQKVQSQQSLNARRICSIGSNMPNLKLMESNSTLPHPCRVISWNTLSMI